MIEVEILGSDDVVLPERERIEHLCHLALAAGGIHNGHLAIEFVDERRITQLNERHRGKTGPTDVLSFPIDGPLADEEAQEHPLELGDVVICPEHTSDIAEAVVHGTLHLLGMDHETDEGEMLSMQHELLAWERRFSGS
ncbi:MAG: rRNA maturation RNase YbeY [Solirubrobacteraceae bacterium]